MSMLPLLAPSAPLGAQTYVGTFLTRYTGATRRNYDQDLRAWFNWCAAEQIMPLTAVRAHFDSYVRWMQDDRHYAPKTVSRRIGTVVLFYRLLVIDGVLGANNAEYVRRPKVPNESPTLGLSHLAFEKLIVTSRDSAKATDEALVAMLGLLGLRVSEACGASIEDLGNERGHRTLRVFGKGGKIVLTPMPPMVARSVDRAVAGRESGPILRTRSGARMERQSASRALRRLAKAAGIKQRVHPHSLRHSFVTTMLDAGVPLRDVQIAARHSDPRQTVRYDRARNNLDRHGNYVLAAFISGAA